MSFPIFRGNTKLRLCWQNVKKFGFLPKFNFLRISSKHFQFPRKFSPKIFRIQKMLHTTFKKCTQPAFAYFCLPSPSLINVRGKQSSTDKEVKDNIWMCGCQLSVDSSLVGITMPNHTLLLLLLLPLTWTTGKFFDDILMFLAGSNLHQFLCLKQLLSYERCSALSAPNLSSVLQLLNLK